MDNLDSRALYFNSMRDFLYRLHLILGLVVSVPILAWSVSGFVYLLPDRIDGSIVQKIDASRVNVSPSDAILRANQLAGKELPITALTLLMKDGQPYYQAIGGLGADSVFINAQTGEAEFSKPPSLKKRFFREAHFYFFAGSLQVPLLIILSLLATVMTLSGIYLNINYWLRRIKKR
ncbi:MAG: hypothetical protein D6735_15430 [Acidobacteria bacterium]|nr:MAG: hypothetical protein D6735_15430 [Acidobacteriota bacterium]